MIALHEKKAFKYRDSGHSGKVYSQVKVGIFVGVKELTFSRCLRYLSIDTESHCFYTTLKLKKNTCSDIFHWAGNCFRFRGTILFTVTWGTEAIRR